MIEKFDISQVRNGIFLSVVTNVRDYVAQENVTDLGLEAISSEFAQSVATFTEVFKAAERGSKHTKDVARLDRERDGALVGLIKHANLFAKFPEKDKAEAGEALARIFKKYGKSPQTKPFAEETGIIIALLAELETPESKAQLDRIGATPWVEVLTRANNEFVSLSKEKTYEVANTEAGATKTARSKTYEVFKKLVKTINALAFLNGEDKYKRLIDNINQELKKA
ncbi:DUF6261 family protein [Capnocytophaga sp.]|uniref:DUF6261 family protein n=1 Tax=Capnocytophaga sp. TaxID=44737 RepID=UPI0026DD1544|nr:DUF6261 family protein [Capnocytophaga sp.]MDO5104440.1 DUF6261 family protein [Capnocytophaga sp.]